VRPTNRSRTVQTNYSRGRAPSILRDVARAGVKKAKRTLSQHGRHWRLTVPCGDHKVGMMANSVSKIQIGQLWKKDGTDETFLVTRVYSEALSTMATLRKSGSETEALVRVKVERTASGQTLTGFSPAQEDERF